MAGKEDFTTPPSTDSVYEVPSVLPQCATSKCCPATRLRAAIPRNVSGVPALQTLGAFADAMK